MQVNAVSNLLHSKDVIEASRHIPFASSVLRCDKFVKSVAACGLMPEKKFQKIFKCLGMSQQELSDFLSQYRKYLEGTAVRGVQQFKEEFGEEFITTIEKNFPKIKTHKLAKPFLPGETFMDCVNYYANEQVALVKDIEAFGKWFSEGDYAKYRTTRLNEFKIIRRNTGSVEDIEQYQKRAAELRELIETYNECATTEEIFQELLYSSDAEISKLLSCLPEKEFQELFDLLHPNIENLTGNKVAFLNYLSNSLAKRTYSNKARNLINFFSNINFKVFFRDFRNTKIPKSEALNIGELSKATRVSSDELKQFVSSLSLPNDKGKEVVVRKILQLKLYMSKISELYDKEISLNDVADIYLNGILAQDKEKIAVILNRILGDNYSTCSKDIAGHLLEKCSTIFEDMTVKRKFFGELQASDIRASKVLKYRNVSQADIRDLISTGFFTKQLINLVKEKGIKLDDNKFATRFIKNNLNYSSLTPKEHHMLCDDFAREFLDNPTFKNAVNELFRDSSVKKQASETLLYADSLSDEISKYLQTLRIENIDDGLIQTFSTVDTSSQPELSGYHTYIMQKFKSSLQAEGEKRPQLFFSKHAILRLIGRDLIEPKNVNGENVDFNSFLTQLYFNAARNKSNFTIKDLNGYSGLNVITKSENGNTFILTMY